MDRVSTHEGVTQPPVERAAGGASGEQTPARQGRVLELLEAYAMVGLLGVVILFFSLWGETSDIFPTGSNIRLVIGNQAVIGVVALAALIPLVAGQWDLSVGAIAGVASTFMASTLSGGAAVPLAILIALGIGLLVGAANALIVTRLRVNAVITTLGMATILAGVISQKTHGLALVSNIPASVTNFGSETWLGIPRAGFALVVVALLASYFLGHTPAGRYLSAYGSNPSAARLVGLRTKVVLASAFLASGALSALGGALQVARAGGSDPRVGDSFTLPALAAAFLSAAAIKPGRYNVAGTLVAIFFLAFLNAGLNIAGAAPYVASYVNGVALIVGVGLAAFLGRKRLGDES